MNSCDLWYNFPMSSDDRKEAVKQAIASERLEGLNVSSTTRRTMDQYISGKISAEEAAEQVYKRYGVKNAK